MPARIFQIYALMAMLAGVGLLVALRLGPDGLRFTGEAPTLQLAQAGEILRGELGQVPDFTALLLVPLLGLGDWSVLLLAVAGQGVAVWLLAGALGPAVAGRPASAVVGAPLLVQAVNGVASPFAGAEGPLLAAASVAVLVGLARAAKGRAPGFLPLAILTAAALRAEGVALALAAVVALSFLGHRLAALLALAGLGTLGAAVVFVPPALGLPLWLPPHPLPTALNGDVDGVLVAVAVSVILALRDLPGVLLAVLAALLALLALARPNRARNAVVWTALAGILLPLLSGSSGWFQDAAPLALAITAYLLQLRRPAVAPLALLAVFGWSHGAPLAWPPQVPYPATPGTAPDPGALPIPGGDPALGQAGPDPPAGPSPDRAQPPQDGP
ncbi:hypothetical protein [Pararhodobacter aggregans]|uniref:hypothetical protein n=1 Tax=Pararhodobacter aggregans TaxID=404875 RepID=UPI003A929EB0